MCATEEPSGTALPRPLPLLQLPKAGACEAGDSRAVGRGLQQTDLLLRVPAAVLAYDRKDQRTVGYLVQRRVHMTHIRVVLVVRRFREWEALRRRVNKIEPLAAMLCFPRKRGRLSFTKTATNASKRLIEARRDILDRYVRGLCALRHPRINDVLLEFLSPVKASASARDMSVVQHVNHPYRFDGTIPLLLHDAAVQGGGGATLPRLLIKVPWGFADPYGSIHIAGETASEATERLSRYCDVFSRVYNGGDRVPTAVEVLKHTVRRAPSSSGQVSARSSLCTMETATSQSASS